MKRILLGVFILAIGIYSVLHFKNKAQWRDLAKDLSVGSIVFSSYNGTDGNQSPKKYRFVYIVNKVQDDTIYLHPITILFPKSSYPIGNSAWEKLDYNNYKAQAITQKPVPLPNIHRYEIERMSPADLISKYPEIHRHPYFYCVDDPPILISKKRFTEQKQMFTYTNESAMAGEKLTLSYISTNIDFLLN